MKLGFIGAGNMATAIFSGALKQNVLKSQDIALYDVDRKKSEEHRQAYGITVCDSAQALVDDSDIIVLAVKPIVAKGVLNALDLEGKALLSIVAGLTYQQLKENIRANNVHILRTMPNTPLMAGCGAVAFSLPHSFEPEELTFAKELFSAIGIVEEVEERLISAVTGISGSGRRILTCSLRRWRMLASSMA